MAAIFIMLGLITAVSLYDFLSSRNWQMVTSAERVETVFADRNHSYGAYKIRKDYNLLIIIITFSIAGTIGAAYGIYTTVANGGDKKEVEKPMDMDTFTEDIKKEEKIEEPLEEKIEPEQKALAFLPPVIVDKPTNEITPTQEDFDDTPAGDHTNPDGGEFDPTKDDVKQPEEKKEEKKEEPVILDIVDESAEYPGGRAAMMAFLQKNIKVPDVATELGLSGKVVLKFVVSSSGNISNVRVQKGMTDCEECDKEAMRVVRMMPDWTPGKVNGKPVNQWFTLPIKFDTQ